MHVLLATFLAFGTFWGGLLTVPPLDTIGFVPDRVAVAAPASTAQEAEADPSPVIRVHTVAAGENMWLIADRYGIDVETLAAANPDIDELLHPGDELVVLPQRGALHVVAEGDTLWRLSQVYGVGIAAILAANGKTGDALTVGERLFIPGGRLTRGEAVSRARGQRLVWPVAGELSSFFGYRWGRLHSGIDIANEYGTPVRAAVGGRVAFAGWWGGYGYTLILDHGQGLSTLYGHLSDYVVAAGEYVGTGQFIGNVGETGNAYGPHLHFEVRRDGQAVNPLSFLP